MERNVQPLLKTFKSELQIQMNKPLIKGETWYLVEYYWLRKCKAYAGFEGLVDRYQRWGARLQPGAASLHPGPIDNKALFKDGGELGELREHLVCEWDYSLITKEGWDMLVEKFSLTQGQSPVARKVVEHIARRPGTSDIDKHCRIDVYGKWPETNSAQTAPGNVDWNQNVEESRTSGKIWPRLAFGRGTTQPSSPEYCRLLPRNDRLSSNAPSTESSNAHHESYPASGDTRGDLVSVLGNQTASSLGADLLKTLRPCDKSRGPSWTAPITESESSKVQNKKTATSTGNPSAHSKQTALSTGWQWHGETPAVSGASNVLGKHALARPGSPYVQCRKFTIQGSVIKKTSPTASGSSIEDSKSSKKPNVLAYCKTCTFGFCTHGKLTIDKGSLHEERTKLSTATGVSNPAKETKGNSVSACNVKDGVERTNEEIVEKLLAKIDVLNNELKEQTAIETAEMAELDKESQESIKALKLSKTNFEEQILNQERKEMQELKFKYRKLKEDFSTQNYRKLADERATFLAKRKSIAENRSSIKTAIEKAVKELTQTLIKLGDNATEVGTDFKKDMECPVCFDEMKPPTRIFQCTNGHLICGGCMAKMKGIKCPTCKEARIMGRAVAMEQLARTLYRQ